MVADVATADRFEMAPTENLDDSHERLRASSGNVKLTFSDNPDGDCVYESEVCQAHIELVKVLGDLVLDIKWMIQIGKWLSYAAGTAMVFVIPILLAFFLHNADLTAKVERIEARQLLVLADIKDQQSKYLYLLDEFRRHQYQTTSSPAMEKK